MIHVKKLLTRILNELVTKRVTLSSTDSAYISSSGFVSRKGHMAVLYLPALKDLTYGAQTQIITLPEEYRPVTQISEVCLAANASASTCIMVNILQSGVVQVYLYQNVTGTINTRTLMTYPCIGD